MALVQIFWTIKPPSFFFLSNVYYYLGLHKLRICPEKLKLFSRPVFLKHVMHCLCWVGIEERAIYFRAHI